ncbi:leucine-rich repeat-containing protein 72-like [Porites lutea]|uniref:leucine-rich repeat-containing protein 72-like n=1 Tax=Porites lutea TaxID=51062 RepID=UPI003CC6132E
MADSEKASTEVDEQLKRRGITKDKDVSELYLANRGLEEVKDCEKYRNLQIVWLNGNKIRKLTCFSSNYQLRELYLQDNLMMELNGCLKHLTCLQVLLLNGNQLLKLTDVVHELRAMQCLKKLNLFGNPLAQEYDYRSYVVHHLPSVELLDRKEITKEERDKARKKYEPERETVKESVAFGRRADGPPKRVYAPPPSATFESLGFDQDDQDEQESRISESITSDDGNALEEAIKRRGLQRSVMQYSTFDWSSIPLSQERRLAPDSIPDQPRILTVRFR